MNHIPTEINLAINDSNFQTIMLNIAKLLTNSNILEIRHKSSKYENLDFDIAISVDSSIFKESTISDKELAAETIKSLIDDIYDIVNNYNTTNRVIQFNELNFNFKQSFNLINQNTYSTIH